MLPFRSWFYAPSILMRAPRKVSISWTRAGTAAVTASVSIFIITFFSPSRVYWISRTCKVNQKYRPWLLLAAIMRRDFFFFFKGGKMLCHNSLLEGPLRNEVASTQMFCLRFFPPPSFFNLYYWIRFIVFLFFFLTTQRLWKEHVISHAFSKDALYFL